MTNKIKCNFFSRLKTGVAIFLVCCLTVGTPAVFAQDQQVPFEQTEKGKLAQELVNFYAKYFTKYPGWDTMPLENKLNVIINEGEAMVTGKLLEGVQGEITEKLKVFAQKKMRLGLLQQKSGIMLNAILVDGKSINDVWSRVDSEVTQELSGKMKALEGSITAVTIGWEAYNTWQTKGPEAGLRSLGGGVADAVLDCMVPGWGTFRLAQSAVMALCEFIMQYSFDVALDAKIKGMFPEMSGSPEAFARWLEKCSASDIEKRVEDDWDLVGNTGAWKGLGTDAGHDAMKDAIVREVMQMRRAALDRQKQVAQLTKDLEEKMERVASDAKNAAEEVKNTMAEAIAPVAAELEKIKTFRTDVLKIDKADAEKAEVKCAEILATEAAASKTDKFTYVPLDVAGYKSMLQAAYDLVTDDPSKGWEYAKFSDLKLKAGIYKETTKRAAKEANVYVAPGGRTLNHSENRMGYEINLMTAAEAVIKSEAAIRAEKANQKVRDIMREISQDIEILNASVDQQLKVLHDQYIEQIPVMAQCYRRDIGEQELKMAIPFNLSNIEAIKANGFMPYAQVGDYSIQYNAAEKLQKTIFEAKTIAHSAVVMEKTIYGNAATGASAIMSKFENKISKYLRDSGDLAEIERNVAGIKKFGLNDGFEYKQVLSVDLPGGRVGNGGKISAPPINYPVAIAEALASYDRGYVAKQYEDANKRASEAVSVLNWYDTMDRMARSIVSSGACVAKVMGAFTFAANDKAEKELALREFMSMGDTPISDINDVSKSDGAEYLKKLKDAQANIGDRFAILTRLKKSYGKGIIYQKGPQPETYLKSIDTWSRLPKVITLWEEALLDVVTMIEDRNKEVAAQREALNEKIKNAYEEEDHWKKIKALQAVINEADLRGKTYNARQVNAFSIDEYTTIMTEAKDALDLEMTTFDAAVKEREKNAQQQNRLAREKNEQQQKEEMRKLEAATMADVRAQGDDALAALYGYSFTDRRINTYALENARGTVVLTSREVPQGTITFTGRLWTTDKAQTMLFSVDRGRTWDEIPVANDISYTFTPMQGIEYMPMVRIKTTDSEDMALSFFPGVDAFVYENINYDTLVYDTVKDIANAYERQDLAAFSRAIARDYLGNRTFLEEGVRFDFDMFTDIRMTIYINRIEQRGKLFVAETKWDKAQMPRKTGEQQNTTGRTTMVFVLEDGMMKIQNLRGNLIYATLSPEIAQASGLSQTVINDIRTAFEDRNPTQPGAGTIEADGGITGGSTGNIVSHTGSVVAHTKGWLFDSNSQVNANGDIMLVNAEISANAIKLISGATQLTDVTTAPTTGYTTFYVGVSAGEVYVVHTADDHYVKFKITALNSGTSMTFDYAYQETAGNTDLQA